MILRKLKASRRNPAVGDVFTFHLPDKYGFGKVIRNDATAFGFDDSNVVHLFAEFAQAPLPTSFTNDELIFPPILINNTPWTRGFFQTIGNVELTSEEQQMQCFESPELGYIDEYGNILSHAIEPVGHAGLHSFNSFDYWLSSELGYQ